MRKGKESLNKSPSTYKPYYKPFLIMMEKEEVYRNSFDTCAQRKLDKQVLSLKKRIVLSPLSPKNQFFQSCQITHQKTRIVQFGRVLAFSTVPKSIILKK